MAPNKKCGSVKTKSDPCFFFALLVNITAATLGCSGSDCLVTMTSHHGRYIESTQSGDANANQKSMGASVVWQIDFKGHQKVNFKSNAYNKYLSAETPAQAKASKSTAGSFEEFSILCLGSRRYAFQSSQGNYMVADSFGSLKINSGNLGMQEMFTIVPYGKFLLIPNTVESL